MGFLSNAPLGFTDAVAMLNALPQSLLGEMCQDVSAFLQYNVGFMPVKSYEMMMSSVVLSNGQKPNAQTCVNALLYIFRCAASESLSVEALVQELKGSFNDGSVAVFREVWKNEGGTLSSLPKQALSVGELLSMDWNLGVSMSSSTCRSLNSPHVSLQMNVSESRGESKTHNIEMTLGEFQNFATQLKEMAGALETA